MDRCLGRASGTLRRDTGRRRERVVVSQQALVRRAVENGPVTSTPHPSALYDDRAQRYADAFQDETVPKFPVDRNMIRMLVDLVGERPRVLDAGCGAGQVTKMLRNWGCDAVGVDAAEKLFAV